MLHYDLPEPLLSSSCTFLHLLFPLFPVMLEPVAPKPSWYLIVACVLQGIALLQLREHIRCEYRRHEALVGLLDLAHLLHEVLVYHERVVGFLQYPMRRLSWAGLWQAMHVKDLAPDGLHIHIHQDVLHLILSDVFVLSAPHYAPDLLVNHVPYCCEDLLKHRQVLILGQILGELKFKVRWVGSRATKEELVVLIYDFNLSLDLGVIFHVVLNPLCQLSLILNHVLLKYLQMHFSDLLLKPFLYLLNQLLSELRPLPVVLIHGSERVIVVDVIGRVFHAQILKQEQQSLLVVFCIEWKLGLVLQGLIEYEEAEE
ncbi:hypothetical protein FGO68_gene4174 [Halteria grandinella]|uniref:Uncharacterized protein n=1 Tax=Halteria grandinella TaxID=5974 RepID=A0A8J8NG76_HALGN|nr:hypothetical protein FGO68_gene4174 [Halteria grandinella]